MHRPMLCVSALAMASAVAVSTASATSVNPMMDERAADLVLDESPAADSAELPIGAPTEPSANWSTSSLVVKKTAETSFVRKWKWMIEKSSYTKELYLDPGENKSVEYEVEVTPEYKDADWAVSGKITIYNPTYQTATIAEVLDVISLEYDDDIYAKPYCGVEFPYYLKAGQYLTCTYYADLPNGKDRKNTAIVKTTGYVEGGTGKADVIFGDPKEKVDECINISDDGGGGGSLDLGMVCKEPKKIAYYMDIGPYYECGDHYFKNVAWFVTKDTYTTGSDDHVITVKVPCLDGCTRTQGYWKTHSSYGPAPYDDTWAKLPNAENTAFFNSGKTWYEVFWTPPKGDPYYILAHQYMAAKLNRLAGADTSYVKNELKYAESLFESYTPGTIPAEKQSEVLSWADILDKFNNGLLGVDHCYD